MAEAMLHVKDFKQISLTAVEVLELLQNSEEPYQRFPSDLHVREETYLFSDQMTEEKLRLES